MAGILFLIFLAGYFWAASRLTKFLLRKVESPKRRMIAFPFTFVAIILLPLADELIGGIKFRAMCERNSAFTVKSESATGRTVRVVIQPEEIVERTPIKIYYSRFIYRDVETGEEVASFGRYVAEGGLLIRLLFMSSGAEPFTFISTCTGGHAAAAYEKNFQLIK